MTISSEYAQKFKLEIMQAKEMERHNLARELHDEMAQYLTGIRYYANSIMRSNAATSLDDAMAIDGITTKIFDVVHNKIKQLRSQETTKENLNFIDTISTMVCDWELENSGISVDMTTNGQFTDVDSKVLFTIFRLIQECLTNITRHAQAKNVTLIIERSEQCVTLTIIDDGNGFEPDKETCRFGIIGMKERVADCGGKFFINSSINSGVTVSVFFPFMILSERSN